MLLDYLHLSAAGLRKLIGVLFMVSCLAWLNPGYAGESAAKEQKPAVSAQQADKPKQHEKGHGLTVFWLVFIVAILFVINSATALNSLGGKPPPRRGDERPGPGKPSGGEGRDPKDRFRL